MSNAMIQSQARSGKTATVGVTCLVLLLATWVNMDGVMAGDGPSFPRIANVYGTLLTSDGALVSGEPCSLEEVARYDLLIGVHAVGKGAAMVELFRKRLAELKQINPHLNALHFACSAPYTHMKPTEEMLAQHKVGEPFPWLLQTDQRLIAGWPGTYMLNLTRPEVIEWLANTTVPSVKDHGYDGVFIDCMGPHFDAWACEIATGREYTVDHDGDGKDDDRQQLSQLWTQAKAALAARTRQLLGEEPIFMANQAHPSLREQLNGIYLEDYIDAVLEGRSDWEKVIELYLEWTHTSHQPNVTVLGCSSGIEPPFEGYKLPVEERSKLFALGKPKLARMRFGLTSTLMGDGYYSYDLHTRWRGQYWWYPEYDAPLGYPREVCHRGSDGTWRRTFDGGVVIVNPTHWDVKVAMEGEHCDMSSGRLGDTFPIPRLDGRIFVSGATSVATGDLEEPAVELTSDGPRGVVVRDGVIVARDGRGLALLINAAGTVESVCYRGQELLSGVRSTIVHDDRWKNFGTENCHHRVATDGALILTGTRTFAQQKIEFTKELRVDSGSITINYQWKALTPLELRAFRQTVDLSPRRFGGVEMRWDDDTVTLPKAVPAEANLVDGVRTAVLPAGEAAELVIRMPQSSQLLDDRCYNGRGYRLTFYPIAGEIPAGRTWNYAIRISVVPPGE